MTQYHVAVTGSDQASGRAGDPFRTINHAAQLAAPGDEVVVHAGTYREWVRPRLGGLSDQRRITYRAATGEHVVIKGSEPVTGWTRDPSLGRTVWRAAVPNRLFGRFNPFDQPVDGDWLVKQALDEPVKHLGNVYLNGRGLFEVTAKEGLADPPRRTAVRDHWTGVEDPVADPDQTQLVWHAEVGPDQTIIWANFQGADPNEELVEINVRRSVFYPEITGRDYITVRGFELAQAASPWAPPTADQPGLIGPNWSKGWIIEDNMIHDAKCSGISIGKEVTTGDNFFSRRRDKPGYQYQLEAVFSARAMGWSKERVGSHVIRRNTIYDCGQTGIVGHLGGVFSQICDNHIYNIALKREFYGYEIAGIKLHAALDVEIRHNRIHDCSLGTWLDWETQGTRVTQNVYYNNDRDIFIEVSHGPYTVDHNIFGSRASIELFSQGGAFVGNLVAGAVRLESVMDRATPYHVPHSTEVAGYGVIYGGDDRWVGNIFYGPGADPNDVSAAYAGQADLPVPAAYGTARYAGHPASFEAYLASVDAVLPGDLEAVIGLKQPVYLAHNLYLGAAAPSPGEPAAVTAPASPAIEFQTVESAVWLATDFPPAFAQVRVPLQSTATLPRTRMSNADFESPDGSALILGTDLLGQPAEDLGVPGPIASLRPGPARTRIW
ncbi:MAG: right-handed parallel beta-helix repeat-containing protein [Bifidobacteriaceae bacterium]|nr:right-handed parallel beta-helix repeat-containing protein [Bifidobacteriaceae bacterium]